MVHLNSLLIISFTLLSAGLSLVYGTDLVCDDLPVDLCAFAVSSSGARCVLELQSIASNNGINAYECQTSTVMASHSGAWIETDDCIESCGVKRMSVGLSSDVFAEQTDQSLRNLCSSKCKSDCTNLFELHEELAKAEGVDLGDLCTALEEGHREMLQIPGGYDHRYDRKGCPPGANVPPPIAAPSPMPI